MGKRLDLDGGSLSEAAILVIQSSSRRIKLLLKLEPSDANGAEIFRLMASRAALAALLELAHEARTEKETRNARDIVQSGECDMAWNTPKPLWWNSLPGCCAHQYRYHILYRPDSEDDGMILCPTKRGYWQLARALLADAPQLIRMIAQETATHDAPKWFHWAVIR